MKNYRNSEGALKALETKLIVREFERREDWTGLEAWLEEQDRKRKENDEVEIKEHLSTLDESTREQLLTRVREQTKSGNPSADTKAA